MYVIIQRVAFNYGIHVIWIICNHSGTIVVDVAWIHKIKSRFKPQHPYVTCHPATHFAFFFCRLEHVEIIYIALISFWIQLSNLLYYMIRPMCLVLTRSKSNLSCDTYQRTHSNLLFVFIPHITEQLQGLTSNGVDSQGLVVDNSLFALMFAQLDCMIRREHDLVWPDWLHWWECPWVPSFETYLLHTDMSCHRYAFNVLT